MIDPDIRHQLFMLLSPFILLMGACCGSFLNVVIWRLPRGESIVTPPSHCPKCGNRLKPWHNIPLLSWLWLRGRCFFCAQPISIRYPIVELVTALLFIAAWLKIWGAGVMPMSMIPAGFLFSALLVATLTDWEHRMVPNAITWIGIGLALAIAVVSPVSRLSTIHWPGEEGPPLAEMILAGLGQVMPSAAPLLHEPRVLALIEVVAGMALCAGVLLSVRYLGRLFWSVTRERYLPEVVFKLTPEHYQLGLQEESLPAFFRKGGDSLTISGRNLEICRRDPASGNAVLTQTLAKGTITLQPEHILVDRTVLAWPELVSVNGLAESGIVRQEVLGLGDLKLLTMIGALMGPDGGIFIIMLASIAGTLVGIIPHLCRAKNRITSFPFAPFIALAALVWFFFGAALVFGYSHVILNLFTCYFPRDSL